MQKKALYPKGKKRNFALHCKLETLANEVEAQKNIHFRILPSGTNNKRKTSYILYKVKLVSIWEFVKPLTWITHY